MEITNVISQKLHNRRTFVGDVVYKNEEEGLYFLFKRFPAADGPTCHQETERNITTTHLALNKESAYGVMMMIMKKLEPELYEACINQY